MDTVRLETSRLQLHPFTLDDVDALHRLWTDPMVRKYLWDDQIIPRETVVEVVEASLESFRQHQFGFWTLSFRERGALIGFCGLRHFTDDSGGQPEVAEVEILYGVAAQHWGKGIATEERGRSCNSGLKRRGWNAFMPAPIRRLPLRSG